MSRKPTAKIGETDWARLTRLSEEDIEAMAKADVDNPATTEADWADAILGPSPQGGGERHREVVLKSSVEIDDELGRRIQRLTDLCRQPTDRFIRDAIEQHATQLEARESVLKEADASWDAYRQDGRHLTGDEVCAWLKSVGTDNEMPLPDSHT